MLEAIYFKDSLLMFAEEASTGKLTLVTIWLIGKWGQLQAFSVDRIQRQMCAPQLAREIEAEQAM